MKSVCAAIFFMLCVGLALAQSGRRCLSYEPTVVNLTGTIISRTFPGPPNYESIRKGDEPENYWLLLLPRPVCVTEGNIYPDLHPAQKNIRRIQLVFKSEKSYETYRRLLGKRVVATGTLYGAYSGHHKTPVLLTVKTLTKAH
jgi:hypothetical protein